MSNAKPKNRYQYLVSNTILFALATFVPKLVTIILPPILSRTLDTSEFGQYDIILNICYLILPIVYISISEAVIRYGSENDISKTDVYTTGVLVFLTGYTIFVLLYPLLRNFDTIGNFPQYIYPFVFASALRTITSHFVRSLGKSKLFAIDGVITTISTMIFTLIFLFPLKQGAISPILGTIAGDFLSAVFLIIASKAWKYFTPTKVNRTVAGEMIKYSLLMMPTAVFWWVISASNRYFLEENLGLEATGLYGYASRIPSLITMVSTVFIQAWQMSAFSESEGKERESFFASIFNSYYTFIFLAVSGATLIIRPVMKIYAGEAFYESWKYVPFLLLAIGISCLVTFLGTIYNTAKKNGMITITTLIGAVLNVALNIILIPRMGIQGAAVATFVGYLIVFIIRAVNVQQLITLDISPVQMGLNIGLLVLQIIISLSEMKFGIPLQILIFVALLALNMKHILYLIRQLMGAIYRRRHPRPKKS